MSDDEVKTRKRDYSGIIFGAPEGYVPQTPEQQRKQRYEEMLKEVRDSHEFVLSVPNNETLTEQFAEVTAILKQIAEAASGPVESSSLSPEQLKNIFSGRKYFTYDGLANTEITVNPETGEETEVETSLNAAKVASHVMGNFLSTVFYRKRYSTNQMSNS